MLKQTISYTDFDNQPAEETLYFNITKSELTDHLHLKDELDEMIESLNGPARDLTMPEVQRILDLVKTFMKLAYGIRSADGKRFMKNDQIWEEFTQTAAYDEFLYSLFTKPERSIEFLLGVLPADLRVEAEKTMKAAQDGDQPAELPTAPPVLENAKVDEPKEPTDEELLKMSPQEMTPAQLQRAYILKSKN